MKTKILLFTFSAFLTFFPSAPSFSTTLFDNGSAFLIAKTVKLGRGAATSMGDMSNIDTGSTIETIKDCDPNCISCNKSTGVCSKCSPAYYLYDNKCNVCPAHATCNGTPDMTCPTPAYYRNGNKCTACSDAIEYCTACTGPTKCTQCASPAYLAANGTCKLCTCTDGTSCNTKTDGCDICAFGEVCNCKDGLVADGKGGCVAACAYTPETCAAETGGTAADWRVEGTGPDCKCATDKKYVMLTDQHPNIKYSPEKYSRIKAVKDFGTIKAGTLGGYIEKEANLSQTGNAWVGCDSSGCGLVTGNAKVYGNALVSGGGRTEYDGKTPDGYGGMTVVANEAEVFGDAKVLKGSSIYAGKVYGSATFHGTDTYSGAPTKPSKPGYYVSAMTIAGEVYGNAHIYAGGYVGGSGSAGANNNPKVYGSAIIAGGKNSSGTSDCRAYVKYLGQVYENARLYNCAEVGGNAKVHGNAIIKNDLFGVDGNAEVYGNAVVSGRGVVNGRAKMYGNAVFAAESTGTTGVPYLCGTAVLSGSAKVTSKTVSNKNSICKNSYSKGEVSWQESYCSSKNCPQ